MKMVVNGKRGNTYSIDIGESNRDDGDYRIRGI